MSFVKPSSITVESGAYGFKYGVSSATMNYIDNNFVNALDVAGSNVISGHVEWGATSTQTYDSGSSITGTADFNAGIFNVTASIFNIDAISELNVQNNSAIFVKDTSAVLFQGTSAQIFQTGTSEIFQTGSGLSFQTGTSIVLADLVKFNAASTVVGFVQNNTTGTSANTLIQAQSNLGAGTIGGLLQLNAGAGTLEPGTVQISSAGALGPYAVIGNVQSRFYPGVGAVFGLGSSLSITPYTGSVNTQFGNELWIPVFVSTAASGANVLIATYTIPNNLMFFIQIKSLRRNLTGDTSNGAWGANEFAYVAMANGSGVISLHGPQQIYSATGFDSSTAVTATTSANTVNIYAVAQTTADDWQFLVRATAC